MNRVKRTLAPYLLVLPGGLWLLLFFVVPMATMFSLSLQQGDVINGYRFTGHWQTYVDAISDYRVQLIRSLVYGLITTVVLVVMSFPIAYWIAFHGGKRKSTYLFLLLLPFFVSFVLRTISWRQILTDDGVLLHPLKEAGLLSPGFHILGTSYAVIFGLVYNSLPFMVLPIYVALERIDPRVLEAARDLYAKPPVVFSRVVLPLALPGVFAGVLMTFVPASADYVNSQVLGSASTTMIGQVIQAQYLASSNYPTASALSFVLMAVLLVGVFTYARALGTEDVMNAAAR
ncbi:ABC transporter permease [Actinoplanes sp. SE50]|uniref:ABC transporter permease n=1 Tax=unclassified Actinoplanes TaxID=2626549 RepID=UPI00023ED3F6|nr:MULTISPECIES: ABC transporter permease [unclassified Actinoplanes]AEV83362.1 Spermidine/putrescine transport system permease protein potB [Actinoplanes sp. SE50/110]ATO81755.1 ABC transporter permease [Actinoplanes sp. SE50]SLL99163.1 ABC transporter permease [Actinoplanes sp. SE50/110]